MHLNKNIDLKTKVHFIVSFTHQALKTVADPQENDVFYSEEHHYWGGWRGANIQKCFHTAQTKEFQNFLKVVYH